jgi:hypothetical protein
MKKFLSLLVIVIFTFSGIAAGAIHSNTENIELNDLKSQESFRSRDYTHTVLVEVGTATWCSACPASNDAWHAIYNSGNYNFEYTELVSDKNSAADARFDEFNPRYVPTSYWDGGEYAYPGTNYGTFYNYLDLAGSRTVPDLVSTLDVSWLGNSKLQINYSVLNNDVDPYPGKMRIYVLELESTLWNDYSGDPYWHAFLDFAEIKDINIPVAGSISDSITWDGVAMGYAGLKRNNLQVILAVFDDEGQTSYSDPPSGNPFTAYYCDECIASVPIGGVNYPPNAPSIDGQNKGKAGLEYEYKFGTLDPDGDDIQEFIINWGDDSGEEIITGPFASGEQVTGEHIWDEDGTYIITAKAKDIYDAESEESEFEVTIPRNRAKVNYLYLWFLERFPLLEMLLGSIIIR